MYSRDKLFQRSLECYFGIYFRIHKYQNNTRVRTEPVRHLSTYIILYFFTLTTILLN